MRRVFGVVVVVVVDFELHDTYLSILRNNYENRYVEMCMYTFGVRFCSFLFVSNGSFVCVCLLLPCVLTNNALFLFAV